jgi:hypothetical protein
MSSSTPELPDTVLNALSSFGLPSVISSALATEGIQFSTPEIIKIVIRKRNVLPKGLDEATVIDKILRKRQAIYDLLAEYPQIIAKLEKTGGLTLHEDFVNPAICTLLTPYITKRAGVGQYLKRRFVPARYRQESAHSTPLTITDPLSGAQYRTTRGAAIRAHDERAKRNIYKSVGGMALLGGAYKGISSALRSSGLGNWRPAAAGGLAFVGYAARPRMGAHYMSDQGVPIPTTTELAKTSADYSGIVLPAITTLGTMAALGMDHRRRSRSPIPLSHPELPLAGRIQDSLSSTVTQHPILAGTAGFLGSRALFKMPTGQRISDAVMSKAPELLNKVPELLKRVKRAFVEQDSTVVLPEVDLDKLAYIVGMYIMED